MPPEVILNPPPPAPAATSTPTAPKVDPVVQAADAARAAAGEPPPAPAAVEPPIVSPDAARESALTLQLRKKERDLIARQNELAARERAMGTSLQQQVQQGVAKELERFKSDPIAALVALGFDKQTIASRLLADGKVTPDETAKSALEAVKKLEAEQRERAMADGRARAENAFADEATDAEKYPHLNDEWTRGEAIAQAHDVISKLRARGIDPNQYSLADIARHLDKVAKARDERRAKAKAERQKKATPQGDIKADGSGSTDQGRSSGTPATTTLGKGLGSRQSVGGKPGHMMTDAELKEHIEAELARSRAAS